MKKIEAIIRPSKLDAVTKALTDLGITGLTVTEVKGFGRQRGFKEVYRGIVYEPKFIEKLKIELVVSDEMASQAISAITSTAKTSEVGDGKIFVLTLENVIRIRTGDIGVEAI